MLKIFKILFSLGLINFLSGCGTYFDLEKYKSEIDTTKPRYAISTVYYIPVYSEETSKKNCKLEDIKNVKEETGKTLTKLCPAEISNCLMQGSCYYKSNSEVILLAHDKPNPNLTQKEDGSYLFKISKRNQACPQGVGIRNICLDPYRSVAADPKFHAPGDVLFFPNLVGTELPNGETHDGYFTVRDSGHNILGMDRFDFFIGFDKPTSNHIFYKKGLSDKNNRHLYYKALLNRKEIVNAERQFPLSPVSVVQFAESLLKGSMP
jgi:3D domain